MKEWLVCIINTVELMCCRNKKCCAWHPEQNHPALVLCHLSLAEMIFLPASVIESPLRIFVLVRSSTEVFDFNWTCHDVVCAERDDIST